MNDSALRTGDDLRAAYVSLLSTARREFCAFTRDLEIRWLGADPVIDAMRAFALRSPQSRIRITTLEVRPPVRDGHRLLALAQRLSSKIELRVPDRQHRDEVHGYAVADRQGFIYRPLADRLDGEWSVDAPRRARERGKGFDEVWATAAPDPNLRAVSL